MAKTTVKVFNVLPDSEQEQELAAYLSQPKSREIFTSAANSGFGTTFKVSHFVTVITTENEVPVAPSKKLEEVKETQACPKA